MAAEWDIYDDMNFYITPERFIVEPNGKDELLTIDRMLNIPRVQSKSVEMKHLLIDLSPNRRVCGVLGTIRLLGGDYLILATHRVYVGMINAAAIWRLAGYDIIPYIPKTTHLTPKQRQQNDMYLQMLRKTLDMNHFYFSYWYDITHSQQRFYALPLEKRSRGLFERADPRFVWNGALLKNFQCNEMGRYKLPLILGFVSINQVQINGQTFFWSIISRRSVYKAGTRFFSRGINDDGHVANFVETEQIVEYNGQLISFIQTRGSMPFFWSQLPNIRYKPNPVLIPGRDHIGACSKHFDEQITNYGKQVLVNLVDQKRAEGALEIAFRKFVQLLNNPNIRYEAFDFHAECKKMRWDRLNILIDRLAHEQDEFSIFHSRNGQLVSRQHGVFRTNCIDCLDRTNVVQSMLARRSLNAILEKLGILRVGQLVQSASPQFEMIFKSVWADNADMISLQYSGTGALKTDFTRTGKRTKAGLAQDGVNSMTRYYLNNFADGFRQDGIDLFLGRYAINESLPSPLVVKHSWRYNVFPSILIFSIAMLFLTALVPPEFNTNNMLFMMFWGALIGVSLSGIFHYSYEFVDWPRLFRPIKFSA